MRGGQSSEPLTPDSGLSSVPATDSLLTVLAWVLMSSDCKQLDMACFSNVAVGDNVSGCTGQNRCSTYRVQFVIIRAAQRSCRVKTITA